MIFIRFAKYRAEIIPQRLVVLRREHIHNVDALIRGMFFKVILNEYITSAVLYRRVKRENIIGYPQHIIAPCYIGNFG